ncbi:MAG: DUF488 domain-containing protein [Ignavibacteriales bacterium]|nr:DUF488 domain-containing protein [Ignavibacteriales bacterium]
MSISKIYTIGHSTHQLEYFLELLQSFGVNCIIDVRSVAASSYNPQYNREPLSNFLREHNITYTHFAREFGARHTEPELLDEEGKVNFDKVRNTEDFKNGIIRLKQGIEKGFTIALMCSESEPIDCHRYSMISVALEKEGLEVLHIIKDKTIKSNAQLENQLLKRYDKKLPKPTMFDPNVTLNDQLTVAYRLKNQEIAFSPFVKEPQEKYG